jgi:hypothetical protein
MDEKCINRKEKNAFGHRQAGFHQCRTQNRQTNAPTGPPLDLWKKTKWDSFSNKK